MEQKVISIVKQLLKRAEEEGIYTIGRTKLVKLLYLAEVEYYRLYQKRLTDLKWKFYHFGPYPMKIQDILGSPDLEEEEIELSNGRTFLKYSIPFDEGVESYVDWEVERLITQIVRRWGDEDLNKLLDYVYFETEPMRDAKRGEILDFSKIPKWEKEEIKSISLNQKKLSQLREKLRSHIAQSSRPRMALKFQDDSWECINIWDEGRYNISIRGTVKINSEDFEENIDKVDKYDS